MGCCLGAGLGAAGSCWLVAPGCFRSERQVERAGVGGVGVFEAREGGLRSRSGWCVGLGLRSGFAGTPQRPPSTTIGVVFGRGSSASGFLGSAAATTLVYVSGRRTWTDLTAGWMEGPAFSGRDVSGIAVLPSAILFTFVLGCFVCFLHCVVLFTVALVSFVLVRLVLCTRWPVCLFALGIYRVCPFWSSCVSHDLFVTDVSQCSCVSQRLSTVLVCGMVGRLSHLLGRSVRFVRLTCRARSPFQPV